MSISKLTTIVIVTYKGFVFKKTLENLNKKFKIKIIENSNDKNFKKEIEKKYSNVQVTLTGKNLGFAKANNIGLKKVKTIYSLVLNPDVEVNSDQLNKVESLARKLKNFGILTCECNHLYETINFNNYEFEKIKKIKTKKNFSEIPYVPGWFMFLKTQDLKKIDYFDENFFLYYEDRDLSKRISKLKKKLYVIHNVKIFHKFGGNSQSANKKTFNKSWHIRFWHLYWSSFYYCRKHYGFLKSIRFHLSKLIRFKYLFFYYKFINNEHLSLLNKYRSDGILSQILNKKAIPVPKI